MGSGSSASGEELVGRVWHQDLLKCGCGHIRYCLEIRIRIDHDVGILAWMKNCTGSIYGTLP